MAAADEVKMATEHNAVPMDGNASNSSPAYSTGDNSSGVTGFEADESTLKKGYFYSSFFIGSMTAICLGLFAGVSGFAYAAPILTLINEDIGPDPMISWVALVYTLTSAVCLTLVGRISDIFGRRWVFIGGAVLGLVGSIVAATAQNVPTLIGALTIIGIGASTQLSYYYVMGELVPMRYRLAGNAVVYMSQIPGSGIAPAVANAFIIYQPNVGWRGPYYLLIAVNAVSLTCWVLFYHPPRFHDKHGGDKVIKYIKEFDYAGTVLYTGGLLILLMGLSWGGNLYAWNSANVIATIVVGVVALAAFVLWETFMNLKEPLVPMYVFDNRGWICATLISGIAASVYYAFAIVWPSMVALLYSDPNNPMSGPWLASLSGLMIVIGEIVGGLVAKDIGFVKWQILAGGVVGGVFFALCSICGENDKAMISAFISIGMFGLGWQESLSITVVTLTAKKQDELGTASGIAGAIRFLISSIASTIYTVVLRAKLNAEIPNVVPPAVTAAGLPESSVADFIGAFTLGPAAFESVPGITPEILDVGTAAYKGANVSAYRVVFLTTIAFTVVNIVCGFLLPDVEKLLTKQVATTLRRQGQHATTTEETAEKA